MDIRVLRYFLAVAREENITRAAENLHISQPSLSKQIMELEKELGKQLIVRGKRKISLTEEGILLKKRANEIISLMELTEREISSDSKSIHGDVSIGGGTFRTIMKSASDLQNKYPDVRFHFIVGDAEDAMEKLDHGILDFAILPEPIDTTKYDSLSLPESSSWGILMKRTCCRIDSSFISKDEFLDLPLIIPQRSGLQLDIANWAGTTPEHLKVSSTFNVFNGDPMNFLKNGLGNLLVLNTQINDIDDKDYCFRLMDPPLNMHFCLIWKRYQIFSKAAASFLEEVKNNC